MFFRYDFTPSMSLFSVHRIRLDGIAFSNIDLAAGRYNGVSAQFAVIQHPVLGDKKYGSKHSFHEGIALRHVRMELEHPITHEQCVFELPKNCF